ncbi:MAG: zinc ribbon domain-containing protein [Candidatus Dadabacteria bacterium]|nr:zinc ribbon domain-containing protein [Candidatus Dadabacteria bacterium]MCY4042995.1 zinc ribbon domain-containing protein [Candidatus Dadabacteria bacterium]MCY4046510.1 zinc ribbon domain-containing protein [Candidatus Dadabacteria bacterium]
MPIYEYECEQCAGKFNGDISALVRRLTKKNASAISKGNPGFLYIEVTKEKDGAPVFSVGEKTRSRAARRFRYTLDGGNILYLELKDFRFSEIVEVGGPAPPCPSCGSKKAIRVFSTFKAIFDKRDREPGPGDDIGWHKDYKIQKDEEQQNWVGQDNLNQYFKQ